MLLCPVTPGTLARSDSREAEARAEVVAGARAEAALKIEAKAEIGLATGAETEAGTLLLNLNIGWLIANVSHAVNPVTLWLLALKETSLVPGVGVRIGT